MTGIYYWKNLITNQMYIGQSINIEQRHKAHIAASYDTNNKTKLYENIRLYGLDNFEFGVLEECEPSILNDRERYYIQYYNTYPDQLNGTPGGTTVQGDSNPNTQLTNEEVLQIRQDVYIYHKDLHDVYELYKDRISYSAFWNMVHGNTWKNVDTSMIYNLQERSYNSFVGSKNPKAKLTEQDVCDIRWRHYQGEENQVIYQDYSEKISYSAFKKVIAYATWKNIHPEWKGVMVQPTRQGKSKAKLTEEDVQKIRQLYYEQHYTESELHFIYPEVTPTTIKRVIKFETWKNI